MKNHNSLILRLFRKYFSWVILSVILGLSGAIFNGIGVTLIIPLILKLLDLDIIDSKGLPPILDRIFSAFDNLPEGYSTTAMISCIILAIVLKNFVSYCNTVTSGILSSRFSADLRRSCFGLLLEMDIQYFSDAKLGDLMNYANGEVNRAAAGVRSLIKVAISLANAFVFLGILILISWQLTLVTVVIVVLNVSLNQFFIKKSKSIGRGLSESAGALSSKAIEVLSGMRLVKSVANEGQERTNLERLIANREQAELSSQKVGAAVSSFNELLTVSSLVLVIFMGRLLFTGNIQAFTSVILTYLFVLNRMMPFINSINAGRNQLAVASSSINILEQFLDRTSKPIMNSGSYEFEGVKDGISFKNIWLRYPTSDKWSLKNINLDLSRGRTLALVGSSGAGKSTLADLLARFYDPTKGSVEVNGIDLKEYSLKDFRKKIGIVSQDTFLLNNSVRENIKYGFSEATDEDVYQACKQANALDFIQNLPQGFDTRIGERGVILSGGQRQRLAIARALLQNPEILILDEATSALDTVSEKLIQDALELLRQERTTLVIAHRLSTVRKADCIAVLEAGEIIEHGSHKELLRNGGKYAELCSMQLTTEQADSNEVQNSGSLSRGEIEEISYKTRSELNQILGMISLLDKDFPEEEEHLKERFSRSVSSIIKTLEKIEK